MQKMIAAAMLVLTLAGVAAPGDAPTGRPTACTIAAVATNK